MRFDIKIFFDSFNYFQSSAPIETLNSFNMSYVFRKGTHTFLQTKSSIPFFILRPVLKTKSEN